MSPEVVRDHNSAYIPLAANPDTTGKVNSAISQSEDTFPFVVLVEVSIFTKI